MRDINLFLLSRSLCCGVRTAATIFISYYLVSTLLVSVDMAVWALSGNDLGGFIHNMHFFPGYETIDNISDFVLLCLMACSCVIGLVGLYKGLPYLVMPITVHVYMDVGLTLISLFSGPWGYPGTFTPEQGDRLVALIIGDRQLEPKETARISMMFGVLFVLYVLMKVYVARTLTMCIYVMALTGKKKDSQKEEKSVSVKLPSYEEAVKMPSPVNKSKNNPE